MGKLFKVVVFLFVLLFVFSFGSCSDDLPTADLKIGNSIYKVEIAKTPSQRRKGLMDRKTVPPGTGMLFVFENDRRLSFWMKDTLVPLSIAYIASDGTIKEIYSMEPESLDPVSSKHFVRYALELPLGAFDAEGVKPGDRIDIPESVLN